MLCMGVCVWGKQQARRWGARTGFRPEVVVERDPHAVGMPFWPDGCRVTRCKIAGKPLVGIRGLLIPRGRRAIRAVCATDDAEA